VLFDGTPRVLAIDDISLESPLEGNILFLRDHDEPSVIGNVGSTLGRLGVNIATFALGDATQIVAQKLFRWCERTAGYKIPY